LTALGWYGRVMPNYFAAYGTLRQQGTRRETPAHAVMRHIGPCLIPGRLYQMGGYPVLKYAGGIVRGDLFQLPWNFDFKIFDIYEDYHPTRPWACRYVRRRVRLVGPKVTAWVYFYAWPIDRTTFYRQGDWLATLESGVQARRFRGDRLPIARYRPVGWPNHR